MLGDRIGDGPKGKLPGPAVLDHESPDHRRLLFEADDNHVGLRVEGLADIGGRRGRFGEGVGMKDGEE